MPNDPMTGLPDWEGVPAETDPDNPVEDPGIFDVRSTSTMVSMAGTPYNEG
jgi:hypothetical protein